MLSKTSLKGYLNNTAKQDQTLKKITIFIFKC